MSAKRERLFSPDELVSLLRSDSRALGLPEGSVEPLARRVVEAVLAWLENRDIITKSDLDRVVGAELEKYSPDLAFVYQNREKVI